MIEPILAPRPCSPCEMLVSATFSSAGCTARSTLFSWLITVCSCSVASEVSPRITPPLASTAPVGVGGSSSSTEGAPNTLVGTTLAVTPAGIPAASAGLSCSVISCSGSPPGASVGATPTALTAPTSAPRNFTSAPGVRPSPTSVTTAVAGNTEWNTPRYCISSSAMTTITSRNASTPRLASVAVGRPRPVASTTNGTPSPRDPDAGVEAPERHGDQHVHQHDGDDAGADGPAGRRADTLRAAGGVEAEVAVDQRRHHDEDDRLEHRVEDVDRHQELVEVVQVGARGLAEAEAEHQLGGQVVATHADQVQRDDGDERGDRPGGHQVGQRPDRHRLQRVDLLGD